MIRLRPAAARGYADHGWLHSAHSFSFADYYDPEQMGFSTLRVINEDRIAGGGGFPSHPHRDMEILTYVMAGALRHEDSMGNGSIIAAGDVQRMTAGTGVVHSERNATPDQPVHLYQIWLLPDRRGYTPEYEQRTFHSTERQGRWQVLASGDPDEDALHWHQDTRLVATILAPGQTVSYSLPDRAAYVQVVQGDVRLQNLTATQGDGARVTDEACLHLVAQTHTEILLFDLPAA